MMSMSLFVHSSLLVILLSPLWMLSLMFVMRRLAFYCWVITGRRRHIDLRFVRLHRFHRLLVALVLACLRGVLQIQLPRRC